MCVCEFLLSVGANWINFVNCCRAPVCSRSTWQSTPTYPCSSPRLRLCAIWPTAASDRAVDLWRIKNIKWHYPPTPSSLLIPFSLRSIGQGRRRQQGRCLYVALWHAIYNLPCMPARPGYWLAWLAHILARPGQRWPCCATGNLFFVCQASLINLHGIYNNNKCNCNYNHDTWKFKRKVKNEYNRIDRARWGPSGLDRRCLHTHMHTYIDEA